MAIKYITCPQCGDKIEVDTEKQFAICQNCGKRLKKRTKPVDSSVTAPKTNDTHKKELTEIEKLFIRANDKEQENDYLAAIDYYNKILDIDPLNQQARKNLNRDKQYLQTVSYPIERINANRAQIVVQYSNKNKYVAFALAIFLGIFGAHNFYLGKSGKAILQLLLSIISLSMGIVASILLPFLGGAVFFVWIWTIIEAIIIISGHATDGYGFKIE